MIRLRSVVRFPYSVPLVTAEETKRLREQQDRARRAVPPLPETPRKLKSVIERLR